MYRKNYYSIRKARSAFESIAQSEKCIAQKNSSPCVTENGEFNAPSSIVMLLQKLYLPQNTNISMLNVMILVY